MTELSIVVVVLTLHGILAYVTHPEKKDMRRIMVEGWPTFKWTLLPFIALHWWFFSTWPMLWGILAGCVMILTPVINHWARISWRSS